GAGLPPPADFTANIKSAYRLPESAAGLAVTYDVNAITPIADDKFQIPGVAPSFLNAPPAKTRATIYSRAAVPTPILGIDVVPLDWELANLFPDMAATSWPFSLLRFTQQRFFFTSMAQTFTWTDQDLDFKNGQNLYGALTVPLPVEPLFELI